MRTHVKICIYVHPVLLILVYQLVHVALITRRTVQDRCIRFFVYENCVDGLDPAHLRCSQSCSLRVRLYDVKYASFVVIRGHSKFSPPMHRHALELEQITFEHTAIMPAINLERDCFPGRNTRIFVFIRWRRKLVSRPRNISVAFVLQE